MGVHESQSLLWERMVGGAGRGRACMVEEPGGGGEEVHGGGNRGGGGHGEETELVAQCSV